MSEKEVTLESLKFGADKYLLRSYFVNLGIDAETRINQELDALVIHLRTSVAAECLDEKTVTYPADWWQAFKQRWFPRQALINWPVIQRTITLKAYELHPEIALPPNTPRRAYVMREKSESCRSEHDGK